MRFFFFASVPANEDYKRKYDLIFEFIYAIRSLTNTEEKPSITSLYSGGFSATAIGKSI